MSYKDREEYAKGILGSLSHGLQGMELRWEKGLPKARSYQTEGENGEIVMEDREDRVAHLPE